MNACVDACVERGRGRRAGAHPDAGTSRGRGSGGWAVGCLLSAALTGGGTAVKAAGGARPCDAVQTCAHPARDQTISRGTSTPLRRACFGPAGPDRACYGGKAVDAETGRTRAEVTAKRTEEAKLTDGLAPMHQRMPLDPTDREPTGHLGAQSPPGARRESSRRDRSDRIYDEPAVLRSYVRSSSTIRDRYFGAAAHQGRADAETRPRFIVTSAVVGATWYTRP